ncbi:MAG: hypothetical protein ACXVPN_14425 [Bacteroidia bacterium]
MKEKGKIVVIEPERIVSMEIKMELELKGYTVIQFSSAGETAGLTENGCFKAIIVDTDSATKEDLISIKRNFAEGTPVIAVSSDLHEEEECAGLKFVQTFVKPINCKSIASLIESNFTALKYH